MEAYIPFLFALIGLNGRLKEDNLLRISSLSLVGASYFLALQYIVYFNSVFSVGGIMQYLPMLIVVIGVIGFSYTSWFERSAVWKTGLFIAALLISYPATTVLDITIKNAIADAGGYFDNGALPVSTPPGEPLRGQKVKLALIGHGMTMPEGWNQGRLPSGHEYIYLERDGHTLVEIRPNCYTEAVIDAPTAVTNNLFSLQATEHNASSSCTRSESATVCFIQVTYGDYQLPTERWRYFRTNRNGTPHTNLDVIFNSPEPQLRDQATHIMSTVKPLEDDPSIVCLTPAAWL